jgi:hypothetical protein
MAEQILERTVCYGCYHEFHVIIQEAKAPAAYAGGGRAVSAPVTPEELGPRPDRTSSSEVAEFVQRGRLETNQRNRTGGDRAARRAGGGARLRAERASGNETEQERTELLGGRAVARGFGQNGRPAAEGKPSWLLPHSQHRPYLLPLGYAQQTIDWEVRTWGTRGSCGPTFLTGRFDRDPHLRMMEWRVTDGSAPLCAVGEPSDIVAVIHLYLLCV